MFACSLIIILWLMTMRCSKPGNTQMLVLFKHTQNKDKQWESKQASCALFHTCAKLVHYIPRHSWTIIPPGPLHSWTIIPLDHYTPGHSWMIIFPGSLHSGTAGPLYPLAHYTAGPLYPLAHYTPRYSWPITLPDQLDYQNSLNLQTWLLKCEVYRIPS